MAEPGKNKDPTTKPNPISTDLLTRANEDKHHAFFSTVDGRATLSESTATKLRSLAGRTRKIGRPYLTKLHGVSPVIEQCLETDPDRRPTAFEIVRRLGILLLEIEHGSFITRNQRDQRIHEVSIRNTPKQSYNLNLKLPEMILTS